MLNVSSQRLKTVTKLDIRMVRRHVIVPASEELFAPRLSRGCSWLFPRRHGPQAAVSKFRIHTGLRESSPNQDVVHVDLSRMASPLQVDASGAREPVNAMLTFPSRGFVVSAQRGPSRQHQRGEPGVPRNCVGVASEQPLLIVQLMLDVQVKKATTKVILMAKRSVQVDNRQATKPKQLKSCRALREHVTKPVRNAPSDQRDKTTTRTTVSLRRSRVMISIKACPCCHLSVSSPGRRVLMSLLKETNIQIA